MLRKRTLTSILLATVVSGMASSAFAASYTLELVGKPVRHGKLVDFSVRLVNTDTKEPVPDTQLEIDDFNMEPEGMYGSETVYPQASDQPGIFNYEVQPIMAGRWGLVCTATVPGEAAPVKDHLVIPIPE